MFRAHADRLSYQTTAAFNCRDLYCWRHSIRPAMSSLSRSNSPTHGWIRRHPLRHHGAGLHRQPGTHRERVSRPAPSRRTDTRQDHPHCPTTQHSPGHTCPRRTALADSLSALTWTTCAGLPKPVCRSLATRVQLRRPRFGNVDTSGSLRIQSRDGCELPLSVAAVRTTPWTSILQWSPVAREVWADSSRSGSRSGDCASSSPTPTTLRPPNSSPSFSIVLAGRSSWTPTLLTQRRSSGS